MDVIREQSVPAGNGVTAMANEVRLEARLDGVPTKGTMSHKALVALLLDRANSVQREEGAQFTSLVCREVAKSLADMERGSTTAYLDARVLTSAVRLPSLAEVSGMMPDVSVSAEISCHEPWYEIESDDAKPGYWNHVSITLERGEAKSVALCHYDGETPIPAEGFAIDDMRLETLSDLRPFAQRVADERAERRRVAERVQTVHEMESAIGVPDAERGIDREFTK